MGLDVNAIVEPLELDPRVARLSQSNIWPTLTMDTGVGLGVLDLDGTMLYLNAQGRSNTLGIDGSGWKPGRTLSDLYGRGFAGERVQLLREAAQTGGPVVFSSMANGVLYRATYRYLSSEALVVGVGCRASVLAESPGTIEWRALRRAAYNDLGPLSVLTERELELLHHIGMGRGSEEAAALMHRSTRTVEWHRASLGDKLACTNRVQLARVAIRAGLTAIDVPFVHELFQSGRQTRKKAV